MSQEQALVSISRSRVLVRRALTTVTEQSRSDVTDQAGSTLELWLVYILLVAVLEGALRKWVVPGSLQGPVFLLKDGLVVAFLWGHPLRATSPLLRSLNTATRGAALVLLPSFLLGVQDNPQSAIITYKNACLWALFAVHLAAYTVSLRWFVFTRAVAILGVGNAVLSSIQFQSPATSWINQYAWSTLGADQIVAGYGASGVRATGTFSYISGLTYFSIFVFTYMLWRGLYTPLRNERYWAIIGTAAALICGLTSGSRAALLGMLVPLTVGCLLSGRTTIVFRAFTIVLIVGVAVYFSVDNELITSYWDRMTGNTLDEDVDRFAGAGLQADYLQLILEHPLGIGLGADSGYVVIAAQGGKTMAVSTGYDHGISKAVQDSGILGVIGAAVIGITLMGAAVRGLVSSDVRFRSSTAILALIPVYMMTTVPWHDHNAVAFNWLQVGIWLSTAPDLIRKPGWARPAREEQKSATVTVGLVS